MTAARHAPFSLTHCYQALTLLSCIFDLNWDSPSCSSNQTKLDANCPCTTKDRKRDIKFAWSHLWLTVVDSCSFALGYFCWIGFKRKKRKIILFFLLAFVPRLPLLPDETNHLELMTKQPNWLSTDKNCCAVTCSYSQESAHCS